MHSRSDLEIKLRLVLGLILLSLVVVLLLRLLLPVLATIGFVAGGYWLWQQYRNQQQRYQRQQARIHAQFYQLLRQQQGRISVLDFAMRTRLSGADAQNYLNTQAQAFSAFFETTLSGDLIYVFNTTHSDRVQQEAHQARAYSEHASAERAYAQQAQAAAQTAAQTAWTNANQIRTLRELSKQGKDNIIHKHIAQIDTPPRLTGSNPSESGPSESDPSDSGHSKSGHSKSGRFESKRPASNHRAAEAEQKDRYINIDVDQTELESSSHRYADSRTIDVTAVRS